MSRCKNHVSIKKIISKFAMYHIKLLVRRFIVSCLLLYLYLPNAHSFSYRHRPVERSTLSYELLLNLQLISVNRQLFGGCFLSFGDALWSLTIRFSVTMAAKSMEINHLCERNTYYWFAVSFWTQMLTKVRIKEYHIATQLSKQLSALKTRSVIKVTTDMTVTPMTQASVLLSCFVSLFMLLLFHVLCYIPICQVHILLLLQTQRFVIQNFMSRTTQISFNEGIFLHKAIRSQ